jgi:hypothetical protein
MCTGFIQIALILLPIGFVGRHYHLLATADAAHPASVSQRAVSVAILLGLYLVINLLLLGCDEVGGEKEAGGAGRGRGPLPRAPSCWGCT